MNIEERCCPICGGTIAFSYDRPSYDFYILKGEIKQDTNTELLEGKNPYLDFYCTNDKTHMLDHPTDDGFHRWCRAVEREFYLKIFPYL